MGNITDLIKDVASKNQIIETFAAKVIEINKEETSFHNPEDAYTVNIMRADGAIIKNVRLKASILDLEQGIITIPKKDSWVLATIIDGVETRAFISQFSEVDRLMGRIQAKNDTKLFFDYSADGNKLHIRYINTETATETDETKITDVAKIEFDKDKNFKISYFDDDEKPLAITHFTPDSLTTTFNSIKNNVVTEGSVLTMTKNVTNLKINDDKGKKRTSLLIKPSNISARLYNDDEKEKLSFEMSGNEKAEIKLTDSNETILLEKDKIQLKKDANNLIEILGQNGVNILTSGNINLKGENINIDAKANINIKANMEIKVEATKDTIIKGDNVLIN
ncbi:hypothetical protein IUY40_15165 [Flavobacterium sp. ALJ2]|uniref:hypothetical protein n=1 Tax=Flavobacterium sp. ALJ2 TaxID=2786960 RepID=UPI0018A0C674|nr:hypothetical protein [Flavobacterium sp. ALJ2]MBF7092874.1 hypothetical protein [Flavobacterium sp. ALJ2]